MSDRVVVVGAGVVGLSCALRLLEAGHRVDVLARDLPLETTSSVAAAVWYPYLALPQDKVTAWGRTTYDELERLAADETSGVVMRRGTELLGEPTPDPWWVGAVPALDRAPPRAPYADGWSFVAPVVEMPRYLAWLHARVEEAGGTVTRLAMAQLPEGPLVVNCSGLGSRMLAGDPSVTPVRGQVVVVEQVGLEEWWLAEDGPTYVIPRSSDIVRRATALVPALSGARVLRHKVGLRPARPAIRLERVGEVIHCYGHGGAGVTLSWGCADEVAALASRT